MQTEITRKEIKFKFSLFSVVVPKGGNEIEYYISDMSKISGVPVQLIIFPKIYRTSFLGKIIMAIRYVMWYERIIIQLHNTPLVARTLVIETKKNIMEFLNNLKDCGYDVSKPLQAFNELINEPVSPKFIPGTKERKTDRLILMAIVFIFFEMVNIFVFFQGKGIGKEMPTFLAITFILFVFCMGIYYLIRNK